MMKLPQLIPLREQLAGHGELRFTENTNETIRILNGDITSNSVDKRSGVSARVCLGGNFGFASAPGEDIDAVKAVVKSASENAGFLVNRMPGENPAFLGNPGKSEKYFYPAVSMSQKEKLDFVRGIDDYIAGKYPGLLSRMVILSGFHSQRALIASNGGEAASYIPRTHIYLLFTVDTDNGPVDLMDSSFGGLGELGDFASKRDDLLKIADGLYEELMRKREGVIPEAGVKECVLAPDLAGILAHEAIGHTVEYDLVQGGSVAGNLLNKQCVSELISMTDFANTAFNETCPVPVYTDDEGIEARDAELIKNGVLTEYLHSSKTAGLCKVSPAGNARAFSFDDEPLIRMRNTCVLPGKSRLEDMIASVEDGYYLSRPGNGQADLTSEFMFAAEMGYEIKNGKLGRAILGTTLSGVAFDMLKTVKAVSDDMIWISSGFCGKKQAAAVGMGGPAIQCRINIGGK